MFLNGLSPLHWSPFAEMLSIAIHFSKPSSTVDHYLSDICDVNSNNGKMLMFSILSLILMYKSMPE